MTARTHHIPEMDTYSVETDGDGGFQVRVIASDGQESHVVASFATLREAQEWVDARTRIDMKAANASDVA